MKFTVRRSSSISSSPFCLIFHFKVDPPIFRTKLDVTMVIYKEGQKHLMATVRGTPLPLTRANLIWTMVSFPVSAFLTFPRIIWEASKLAFRKKLPVFSKPNPQGFTIVHLPPTPTEKFYMDAVLQWLDKLGKSQGHLIEFLLPGYNPRESLHVGMKEDPKEKILIDLKNYSFFSSLARNEGLATFATSFMDGSWETSNLDLLLTLLLKSQFSQPRSFLSSFLHSFRGNPSSPKPSPSSPSAHLVPWIPKDQTLIEKIKECDEGTLLVVGNHVQVQYFLQCTQDSGFKGIVKTASASDDFSSLSKASLDRIILFDDSQGNLPALASEISALIPQINSKGKILVLDSPLQTPDADLDLLPLDGCFSWSLEKSLYTYKSLVCFLQDTFEQRYFSSITNYVVSPFELIKRHDLYVSHLAYGATPVATKPSNKLAEILCVPSQTWKKTEAPATFLPLQEGIPSVSKGCSILDYEGAELKRLFHFYLSANKSLGPRQPRWIELAKPE